MAEKEPVSLTWQTIMAIIPIVSLAAAWRIEKFRIFLGVNVLMVVGIIVVLEIVFPQEILGDIPMSDGASSLDTILSVSATVVNVILIRKWSREWNGNFSQTNSNNTGNDLFYRE